MESCCNVCMRPKHTKKKKKKYTYKRTPPELRMPDTGFVRLPAILFAIPMSRDSWEDGVSSGKFPKPVKILPRTKAWRVADIKALIEKLSAEGNGRDRSNGQEELRP
jgi:prophage regulatory protein